MSKMEKQVLFYRDLYWHFLRNKFRPIPAIDETHIPKKIHYCWFGRGPYRDLEEKCLASWQRVLPEYEYVLWNEDNFPINEYPFVREAYQKRKFAFVSDFVRLYALKKMGGIYMDTDVEILKPLDVFLHHGAFSGYENFYLIPTALMGARKNHPWINLLLDWYHGRHFTDYDAQTANTRIISKITALFYNVKLDGQEFELPQGVHIYPSEYFCPRSKITEHTYCIHHFSGSWK